VRQAIQAPSSARKLAKLDERKHFLRPGSG